MNRLPPCQAAWLPGALVFLVLAPSALAQPSVPFDQDNHAFRFVLWQLHMQPISEPNDIFADPGRTIVIVFGQTRLLPELSPSRLRAFVNQGGALLIATDQRTDWAFQQQLGFHVTGEPVREVNGALRYRGSAECPLVVAPSSTKLPQALFGTEKRLATNKPSYLADLQNDRDVTTLAYIRPFGERWLLGSVAFAWGGNRGSGHLLVLADHSVFINGMMLQTDNGNFDFACDCVHWLSDAGQRSRALFYDEGMIVNDFRVPLTEVPVPPISPLKAADAVIAALEQDDVFNRLILEQFSLRQILSAGAVALTVMLLIVLFYRLMRAGYHIETHVPLVAQGTGQGGADGAVMDQRRQALLQTGNLWEPARDVARQWFADLGYRSPAAGAPNRRGRPSFWIDAGWWRRRRLRGQVDRLWRLAFQPPPRQVSRRDFERLLIDVHDLRAAVQAGVVQLQRPGTTA